MNNKEIFPVVGKLMFLKNVSYCVISYYGLTLFQRVTISTHLAMLA
jgi:hypothetical protein